MDNKNNNNNVDIEIVMGDDSNLKFSEVEDCVNTLRPKDKATNKDKLVFPKKINLKKKENN